MLLAQILFFDLPQFFSPTASLSSPLRVLFDALIILESVDDVITHLWTMLLHCTACRDRLWALEFINRQCILCFGLLHCVGRYFLVLPRKYPKKAPQGRRFVMSIGSLGVSFL